MTSIWLRNELPPVELKKNEFVGPAHQSTWIDPLDGSGVVHKGRSVDELEREGYVGVYVDLKDWDGRL